MVESVFSFFYSQYLSFIITCDCLLTSYLYAKQTLQITFSVRLSVTPVNSRLSVLLGAFVTQCGMLFKILFLFLLLSFTTSLWLVIMPLEPKNAWHSYKSPYLLGCSRFGYSGDHVVNSSVSDFIGSPPSFICGLSVTEFKENIFSAKGC